MCCVLFARACFEEISLVPVSRDIFFDFLGENAPFKGESDGIERKRRQEVMKERVSFFVFWRERFVCCFAQKKALDETSRS